MKRNEKIKREFERQIKKVTDVYMFITAIFEYTTIESKQKIEKKYYQLISSGSTNDLNVISKLVQNLCVVNRYEFDLWLQCWIDEFKKTSLDDILFCYITLMKFDDVVNVLLPSHKSVFLKGPMNTYGNRFFYKKHNSFFESKLKTNHIREGRQTVEHDSNSINKVFSNFEVIKESGLYEYTPEVKQYKHTFEITKALKFGVSSFSNTTWFKPELNYDLKSFVIEYEPTQNQIQNDYIKNILVEFEENEVDIVIFPELAMNPETQKEIQEFIIESGFKHIKLCFLGSGWDRTEEKNEAVLLSNQGSVLINEQKQIPYRIYVKEISDYCTESIDGNKKIMFVDLDGIGRIAYLICADFNDDSINSVCSLLHADFVIVSAFSGSTNEMYDTAKSNAERKAITTVLCNSCAAIEKDAYAAFAVAPKILHKKLEVDEIYKKTPCKSGSVCSMCTNIFTIIR